MGRRLSAVVVLAACLMTSCDSEGAPVPAATATGAPHVDVASIEQHATQFDDELEPRPAGSQREFLAATYILGHLQQTGYVPLLDAVPVGDLVRSTNVVAPPPSGADMTIVVAVSYDSGPGAPSTGEAIGLWLELARAVQVRNPDHTAGFVAMGADRTEDEQLGSRRLAKFLLDKDLNPVVVTVGAVDGGDATLTDAPGRSVFEAAGFTHRVASGSVTSLGAVLLDLLTGR
jgi:hypothetical protein